METEEQKIQQDREGAPGSWTSDLYLYTCMDIYVYFYIHIYFYIYFYIYNYIHAFPQKPSFVKTHGCF